MGIHSFSPIRALPRQPVQFEKDIAKDETVSRHNLTRLNRRSAKRTSVRRIRRCETRRSRRTHRLQRADHEPVRHRNRGRQMMLSSRLGSTQVSFARIPLAIMSAARSRVESPQTGKSRHKSSPLQLPLTVSANVLQEEISKCDRIDVLLCRTAPRRSHQLLVGSHSSTATPVRLPTTEA